MSFTGWGIRSLSDEELKDAYDFPLWSPWMPTMDIPIKVCLTLLESFLGDAQPFPCDNVPLSVPAAMAPIEVRQDTWLPALERRLPGLWADEAFIKDKAAALDDKQVEHSMWDQRITLIFPEFQPRHLEALRRLVLNWQCRRLYKEFRQYLVTRYGPDWQKDYEVLRTGERSKPSGVPAEPPRKRNKGRKEENHLENPLFKDVNAGWSALHHYFCSTWWEWKHGSALLFWRWSSQWQKRWARDGMPVYVKGRLPTTKTKQRPPSTQEARVKIAAKLSKVLDWEYIDWGLVLSLIEMFAVVKDIVDIRMVYNGTKSGLNEAVWAPLFFMPNASSATRLLSFNSFCVDLDLGEMFLNFYLDEKIRPFAGVDLTLLKEHLKDAPEVAGQLEMRWNRQFMGMKPSPYNSVCSYYFAEEFARGNPRLKDNPMRYDQVILNCPGSNKYNPSLPRVMMWNDLAAAIAGDVVTFVDDLRASGYSFENVWQVAGQIASRPQYLGIQDAPRKRRPSSQKPGAWAGAVFQIDQDKIIKTVTQEKWDKARRIIAVLLAECLKAEDE